MKTGLNSTGSLGLGGSNVTSSIQQYLRGTPSSSITMNDSDVRTLANRSSGAISFSDLRGKPGTVTISSSDTWLMPSYSVCVITCFGGGGGGGGGGANEGFSYGSWGGCGGNGGITSFSGIPNAILAFGGWGGQGGGDVGQGITGAGWVGGAYGSIVPYGGYSGSAQTGGGAGTVGGWSGRTANPYVTDAGYTPNLLYNQNGVIIGTGLGVAYGAGGAGSGNGGTSGGNGGAGGYAQVTLYAVDPNAPVAGSTYTCTIGGGGGGGDGAYDSGARGTNGSAGAAGYIIIQWS